jgi:heat shock protein HslJ
LGTTRSINGSYVLESLTIDGVELDIDVGLPVTLNLNAVDRTDMTGTGPCNDFSGSWAHDDGRLVVTNWVATERDCPDADALAVEVALFEALAQPIQTTLDLDQTPARLLMSGEDASIVWSETTPPETQPTISRPFSGSTTTIPGRSDPPGVDV